MKISTENFFVFKSFLSFPVELPLMNIPIIDLLVVKKCETSESIQFSSSCLHIASFVPNQEAFFTTSNDNEANRHILRSCNCQMFHMPSICFYAL